MKWCRERERNKSMEDKQAESAIITVRERQDVLGKKDGEETE